MYHATPWTTNLVITEGFLSSAPKTSKRTRRPRPKPKTTPTPEAPQTKLGKCGFLVKGVHPWSYWESMIDTKGGSGSLCGCRHKVICSCHTLAVCKGNLLGDQLCSLYFLHKDSLYYYASYLYYLFYFVLLKTKY
jgi:hypothetical protein